ncbi:heat stress transcription factor A-7a-like isoform X2 [Cynara cardunculus var. scolymus]|uniref:heat stress transcription factor A-7a-like isoform X2 n=1 Tax=Cynara cardunculus var. scolymus TaxID=59895 RepID=UPI000D62F6EC|nr:heat stress transcription factor A-7a-like isoform X2 [Cynara cardunculus var. scolymus]
MDPFYSVVKEEYPLGGSSSTVGGSGSTVPEKQPVVVEVPQIMVMQVPQPMEGLHDSGPPPFLTKVYEMVDDPNFDHILSWSRGGQSFVVWDTQAFSTNLLPRYFKHNNFSSFIRQLNTYGFRKIDPDIWEFANEAFLKGQRHILKNIKRRKTSSHPPPQQEANNLCVEVGTFGLDGEVERLRRDKRVLMTELVKLRQQQQNTRSHLKEMELRLKGTEKKRQKMMGFLAKALQNPEFIQKLASHGERKNLAEAFMKERRKRPIDHGSNRVNIMESSETSNEFGDLSELEELALEMQGVGRLKRSQEEEAKDLSGVQEFDEEFWEELFSERFDIAGSEDGEADS